MSQLRNREDIDDDTENEQQVDADIDTRSAESREFLSDNGADHFVQLLEVFDIDQWDILDAVPKDILFGSILRDRKLKNSIMALVRGEYSEEAFTWLEENQTENLYAILHEPRDENELRDLVIRYFIQEPEAILVNDLHVPKRMNTKISLCAYNKSFGIIAVEFPTSYNLRRIKGIVRMSVAHSKYVDASLIVTTPYIYIRNHKLIDECLAEKGEVDYIIVSTTKASTKLGNWDNLDPDTFY